MKSFITLLTALFLAAAELGAEAPKLIEVQVSGHGPPVLFIPGMATSGAVWGATVQQLQDRYQCHVISIAGFGPLPPVKTDHFLVEVRDQIIGYARGQNLIKPILVGHSLGAMLAFTIGEQAPDLPGGIISVDGLPFIAGNRFPGVTDEAGAKKAVAAARSTIERETADQFAPRKEGTRSAESAYATRIAELCGGSDPATVTQARIEIFESDFRAELDKIKCPILMLGALGEKWQKGPRSTLEANYKKLFENAPQTRFRFFPEARHYLMLDDPAGFYAALNQELAADRSDR